jgi:hypothetical protein
MNVPLREQEPGDEVVSHPDAAQALIDQCALYFGEADTELFRMWFDCQVDVTIPEHYQVDTYPEWLQAVSIDWEQAAREGKLDEVEDWLTLSRAAAAELDKLYPPCGACGQSHRKGRAKEECELWSTEDEEGVHVTIDLTVWNQHDPVQYVRDGMSLPEGVYVDDVFRDDPE